MVYKVWKALVILLIALLLESVSVSTGAQAKSLMAFFDLADPHVKDAVRQPTILRKAASQSWLTEISADAARLTRANKELERFGGAIGVVGDEEEGRAKSAKTARLRTRNKQAQQMRLVKPKRRNTTFRFGPFEGPTTVAQAEATLRKALMALQNPKLSGGDILIRSGQRQSRKDKLIKFARSALVSSVSLWQEGVIFYEFDPSVDQLTDEILRVMQQFHEKTCIRFAMRKNNEPDYLRIGSFKGCFSYIGRIGGEQILSLGDGCEYSGTIAHELLHALGFYHHQNRSDRDDFLDILWENIARGKENQFIKMAPQDNLLLNEFDYNSVMLYGPRTFGKTIDKVTMKPKRDGVMLLEVMEKKGPSLLDIDSVNKLYNCRRNEAKLVPLY